MTSASPENTSASSSVDQAALTEELVSCLNSGMPAEDIRTLLAQGASATRTTGDGTTPLQAALQAGDWQAAEILHAHGARVPPQGIPTANKNLPQVNALNYAIGFKTGYEDTLKLLLSGTDPNARDGRGETALSAAMARHWPFLSAQLVRYGGWLDPDNKDPDEVIDRIAGTTRLLAALLHRDEEQAAKTLAQGANPDKADLAGLTPLALARAMNWPEMEQRLLAAGASPDVRFPDIAQIAKHASAPSPLCYALGWQGAHASYISALIKAGADVNAPDHDGKTPAHWASGMGGAPDALRLLAAAGADLTTPDYKRNGLTPLHYASMKNRLPAARFLLETAALSTLNTPADSGGMTPLHLACTHKGAARLAQFLLDHGALVNNPDRQRTTPLWHAIGAQDTKLIRTLIENGADLAKPPEGTVPPAFRIVSDHLDRGSEMLRLLVENGADPNVRAPLDFNMTSKDDSLLYCAFRNSRIDLARVLLAAGADPHGTNQLGSTAMHLAIQRQRPQEIQLLLDHGFDPLRPYSYTETWDEGSQIEHRSGTCRDYAREMVQKFPHFNEYGRCLEIIDTHIAAQKAKQAPRPPRPPAP